jgi:transcriptional regulator with PAS, ATPase and Fis domain
MKKINKIRKEQYLKDCEKTFKLMEKYQDNVTVAYMLGISTTSVWKRIKKYKKEHNL